MHFAEAEKPSCTAWAVLSGLGAWNASDDGSEFSCKPACTSIQYETDVSEGVLDLEAINELFADTDLSFSEE